MTYCKTYARKLQRRIFTPLYQYFSVEAEEKHEKTSRNSRAPNDVQVRASLIQLQSLYSADHSGRAVRARKVLGRSDTGIAGKKPAHGLDVCQRLPAL